VGRLVVLRSSGDGFGVGPQRGPQGFARHNYKSKRQHPERLMS
jgi:hypothetical protein